MEGAVFVVDAGVDELGQHVVGVGGADEALDRQAHLRGEPARQDVAEVAGGDAEDELLPRLQPAAVDVVAVSGEIVDDLRQQTAPVDRVGRGEEEAAARQLLGEIGVAEDLLDAGLRVVKVALHGADAHVVAALRHHLEALDRGDAAGGIEDEDLRPRNVGKALKRRLAGVAGGGHEDADLPRLAGLLQGGGQEIGQHLQRHVLEGAGGAVPELQIGRGLVREAQRGDSGAVEILCVCVRHEILQLLRREIREEAPHDVDRSGAVIHRAQGLELLRADGRNGLGHEKPAVRRKAHRHGLRCAVSALVVSGAEIIHMHSLKKRFLYDGST